MEIDLPEVVAEVKAAFDRYEKALGDNDVATLNSTFRKDPRTIRYGGAENFYGYAEIESFRVARAPARRADNLKNGHQYLRPRPRRRFDAVSSRQHARESRPADADLGSLSGRLARRRRARELYRRAEVNARCPHPTSDRRPTKAVLAARGCPDCCYFSGDFGFFSPFCASQNLPGLFLSSLQIE